MKGVWMGDENNHSYKYNGIEQNDNFGIDLSFAHYRTLDPTIGRWLQVDPMAEPNAMYSPYNSMNNNPISNVDPDGDLPFLANVGIGAIMGGFSKAIPTLINGGSLGDVAGAWFKGIAVGSVGGALSSVGGGTFAGNVAFGAVEGGVTGGLDAALSGENIGQGAINGAKWGAIFAGATSGIEATGNAIKGHGFRTDVGVIRNYSSDPSTYQNAINFIQDKYGLTGVSISASGKSGKDPITNSITYGETTSNFSTGISTVSINNEAFANPNILKETVAHEFAHAKYGLVPKHSTAGFKHRMGGLKASNGVVDYPEGWVFAAQNRGRLKVNGNGIFNGAYESADKLRLKNLKIQSLPTRFNNKANFIWGKLR